MAAGPAKIVILGGTGWIGSWLRRTFEQNPSHRVEAYSSSTLDLTDPACMNRFPEILTDSTTLIMAARPRRGADEWKTLAQELAMVTYVAQGLAKQPVRKCVYFSSTSVYQDTIMAPPLTEQSPIQPRSAYGIAKSMGETILREAAERKKFPILILRPCMVYGPGDTSPAYGPAAFLQSAVLEHRITLKGDGSEKRDYLFVKDAAELTVRLALGSQEGVFNLATGESHSFRHLAELLAEIIPDPFEISTAERKETKGDQSFDNQKLRSECPDFSFTPLEEGLRETYGFFSKHLTVKES